MSMAVDAVMEVVEGLFEDAELEAAHWQELSRKVARKVAEIDGETGSTTDPVPVREMVRKLDNRQPGSRGYVTYTPEIIRIMSNLSPLVPWNVFDTSDGSGLISVELKTQFCLERELL